MSANRCRTHYGDGPVRLSPTAIDSLATVWNDARQSYQSLARLYESLSQADNADTAMMASVADAMGEQAHEATMAAGDILRSLPAEIASHVVRGDGEAKGAMTPESESLSGFAVSVIPTPAHTWITVEYTLPECCDNADFELASITGVKVMTATLDGNKGSKTLDLKGLPGGVYLYTVHCGNHNYNGKVVVTK